MSFYNTETKSLRGEFLYPPFVDLISIQVYGHDNVKGLNQFLKEIYNIIKGEISWLDEDEKNKHLIGPYPAPLEKDKQ